MKKKKKTWFRTMKLQETKITRSRGMKWPYAKDFNSSINNKMDIDYNLF